MNRVPGEAWALVVIVGLAGTIAMLVQTVAGHIVSAGVNTPTPIVRHRIAPSAPVPGPLSGQRVSQMIADSRPVAVVVDNFYPDARPQSGVGSASVVFEAPVEGGFTRLLALFLERRPPVVGPIRSARPYLVDWAASFRAIFVHAGGSPEAQRMISGAGRLVNIEALFPHRGIYRTSDRTPPHNLFARYGRIQAIAARKHVQLTGFRVPSLLHRNGAMPANRGPGKGIRLNFSLPTLSSPVSYRVAYHYDAIANGYLRFVGDNAALDQASGKQIEPNNVVVMITSIVPIAGDQSGRLAITTEGQGHALYLRDGRVISGVWKHSAIGGALHFLDLSGRAMRFDRGSTWIEVVPPGGLYIGS